MPRSPIPSYTLHSLPPSLPGLLAGAPLVGFTGSRAPSGVSRRALAAVLRTLPACVPVVVGCARGIDAHVRAARPSAQVLAATGTSAWALAARSTRLVRSVQARGGVLVAFPAGPCPARLAPARSPRHCFTGHGSGTWATLALAVGLGIPAAAFLPPGIRAPLWLRLGRAGWHLVQPPLRQTTLL